MTTAELVAQLRDIHLPQPGTAVTEPIAFSVWPLAVFAIIVGGVIAIGHWRRNAWRRRARAEFERIRIEPDRQTRWSALLRLAQRISPHHPTHLRLPGVAYRSPTVLNDADVSVLERFLATELRR